MNIFNKIFLLILFSISAHAGLNYETCNCTNKDFTNSLTKKYLSLSLLNSSGIPSDCYASSMLWKQKLTRPGLHQVCLPFGDKLKTEAFQKEAFPAGECENHKAVPSSPCINRDYVEITKKAFEETMGCFDIDTKSVFAIINFESHFIINAISATGAACYGQLKPVAIADVNKRNSLELSLLKSKCPQVGKFFKPIKTERNIDGTYAIPDVASHCEATENPYTCLVYTALNYKNSLSVIKSITDSAQVQLTPNSKPKNIFANRTPIEELIQIWAYTGGNNGITSLYESFLKTLNNRLEDSAETELRKEFLASHGLKTSTFYNLFSDEIRKNYGSTKGVSQKQRAEVANYISKIKQELVLTESRLELTPGQCSSPNSFLSPLYDLKN